MDYTMEDFWIPRLSATARAKRTIPGWSHVDSGLSTFLEAPLTLGHGFGDREPTSSKIILVSAPGAVGKTTLARRLAFGAGAMLVDLAEAAAVGASTMTGGLAKTGLYDEFLRGEASLVVDGLDEARIRVTQAGFSAYMEDLIDLVSFAKNKECKPVVLFGRTGAVEESWLLLSEQGVEVPVLEIGYFDFEKAKEFSVIQAEYIREVRHEPDERAIELLLNQLKDQTLPDGNSFIGYSPVLIAVAKRVADPSDPDYEKNTAHLISRIEREEEQITLAGIAQSILEREQTKIRTLEFSDELLCEKLYSPKEQLARLVDRVYGGGLNFDLPDMLPQDRQAYENALDTWVAQHPFLDGVGQRPSSAVFGGLIAARALGAEGEAGRVLSTELNQSTLVNPFLAEFYLNDLREAQDASAPEIPALHVGLIYASVCARLSSGQTASLRIEADGPVLEDEGAEVEVVVEGQNTVSVDFKTDPMGHFRFGRRMQSVTMAAPMAELDLGGNSELILVAPISIDVDKLSLNAEQLSVEQPPVRARDGMEDVVDITARQEAVTQVAMLPRVAEGVTLEVRWPGSTVWPWSAHSVGERLEEDPRIYDGVSALLRILRLFKSKGKGNLAKYCGAIDHRRRTYGLGESIRDQLLSEHVLIRREPFYFLDPDQLMVSTGLMYNTVRAGVANDTTRDFVRRALED